MRPIALWLSLSMAGPAGPSETVGVAWYDEATAAPARRQRLVDTVADTLGVEPDEVIDDAVAEARRVAAHEIPRARVEALVELGDRLEIATVRYRAGELDEANAGAEGVLEALRADPVLPGATRLAWRAELLRARVAWTRGDDAATASALRALLALDPEATVSTRRVPPAFAAVYDRIQTRVLEGRVDWEDVVLDGIGPDARVEIDGRPGMRPLPPGRHFVVVRRAGAAPWGTVVEAGRKVAVPPPDEVVPAAAPSDRDGAEAICDRLDLDRLVLARVRGDRLGLQGYACGRGYGRPWYSGPDASLAEGVAVALGRGEDEAFDGPAAAIGGDARWPRIRIATESPQLPVDRPVPDKKPWYRRAWVWILIGSVAAAGITTGAVLGTRHQAARVVVKPSDWLGQ